ncbi:unnamed protein product, partial [Ectocarpus sp. 4 AP-2014]
RKVAQKGVNKSDRKLKGRGGGRNEGKTNARHIRHAKIVKIASEVNQGAARNDATTRTTTFRQQSGQARQAATTVQQRTHAHRTAKNKHVQRRSGENKHTDITPTFKTFSLTSARKEKNT